jgi:hypothetical protein
MAGSRGSLTTIYFDNFDNQFCRNS